MEKPWYEAMFENYAHSYDKESFTLGTLGECDFIEKELGHDKRLRILDVGCGTGRHAIELSRRGYTVTGIDYSENQLARAREKATEAGLVIDFRCMDARQLTFNVEFDLAIMLCEGAFPLMETDEMNYDILKGIARALKSPGKLIFTTLNGLFPLAHSIEKFHAANSGDQDAQYAEHFFNPITFRDHNLTRFTDDAGNSHELRCHERYYIPPEITWQLRSLGFQQVDFYGARLGEFSREHSLRSEDFEMLVIAEI